MSQSIREREDELFAEWRSSRTGFVADGVVDEVAYLSSSPRVLFILKEVNDPEGGEWDLRTFMREGGRVATWSNLARWTDGLRSLDVDRSWSELSEVDAERRVNSLRSIAAMNLKKTPGGTVNVKADLYQIATEDRVHLNRQFAMYDADIVICCGPDVAEIVHRLIDVAQPQPWRLTRRGVEYREYGSGKLMITHTHPTARLGANLLYYGLIDAVREIFASRSQSGPTS